MTKKLIPLAIAYDFDGTLAPGNMQERDFIPNIGMTNKKFWDEVSSRSKDHNADNILIYMGLMLEKAREAKVTVRKEDFNKYGKDLPFFEGILPYDNTREQDPLRKRQKGWFDRINVYGKESGVDVQHYVISSGIREMVEGSPISKKFKAIYASSFCYDHHGVAEWPALALNYTTKTQYLFRVNKGTLDVYDNKVINDFVPHEKRAVPFEQMVFIGDGETDVPCFRLVKDLGGHSIAVYAPRVRKAKERPQKLIKEGRVNFMAPADYRNTSELDRIVKGIIDKIASGHHLKSLGKS